MTDPLIQFREHGYAALPVFDPALVTAAQADISEHIDRLSHALYLPFEKSHPDAPLGQRLDRIWQEERSQANLLRLAICTDAHRGPRLQALAQAPELKEAAENLCGRSLDGQVVRLRANIGVAAHKDRAKVLDVLADPHVGSLAVVTIGLQLLAKLVLLHAAVETRLLWPLILIPFAARIGPLAWTRFLPPLHQGLAARFRDAVRPIDIALWALALLVAGWFVPALLAMAPFAALWGWHLRRRFGGISGDGHGAGIELGETVLLVAVLIGARFA